MERADVLQTAGTSAAPAPRIGTAYVRVAPSGSAAAHPRRYRVLLEVTPSGGRTDEMADARGLAVRLLEECFGTSAHAPPVMRDVWSTDKPHRGHAAMTALIAIEAELECAGWPVVATARLQALLDVAGYRVMAEERRACAEPGCGTEAVVLPNRRGRVESGWYSETLCGKHNYKTCSKCSSVHRLVSSNVAGPAPSVACTVCGSIMVEWGGTKQWEVELVAGGVAAQ